MQRRDHGASMYARASRTVRNVPPSLVTRGRVNFWERYAGDTPRNIAEAKCESAAAAGVPEYALWRATGFVCAVFGKPALDCLLAHDLLRSEAAKGTPPLGQLQRRFQLLRVIPGPEVANAVKALLRSKVTCGMGCQSKPLDNTSRCYFSRDRQDFPPRRRRFEARPTRGI